MDLNKKIEVLAPVGDIERLKYAIAYGADAVYLGGTTFGMRATSANFDYDTLKQAVIMAHAKGVKVYLTCNTLPTNDEVDGLEDYLKNMEQTGIDAVIVADIGILMTAKRVIPNMEIHISTQTGIVNHVTATELYKMGAKRIVLARELDLENIKRIRDKIPAECEIEAFVHGAMCMSFSGRCLISNYMVGRDANRGECAQPCRWKYNLVEEKRPGQYFPIEEDETGSYILNAKDLSMIDHVDDVIKAGVNSLKIEGRAKSFYYVAVVTNAYRKAVDVYLKNPDEYKLPQWISDEVAKVSHRTYSTGFFYGRPESGQYYENGGYVREYDVVATVDKIEKDRLICTARNKFSVGEEIEIISPTSETKICKIESILNMDEEPVESANHPMTQYILPCDIKATENAIIRRGK